MSCLDSTYFVFIFHTSPSPGSVLEEEQEEPADGSPLQPQHGFSGTKRRVLRCTGDIYGEDRKVLCVAIPRHSVIATVETDCKGCSS